MREPLDDPPLMPPCRSIRVLRNQSQFSVPGDREASRIRSKKTGWRESLKAALMYKVPISFVYLTRSNRGGS